MNKKILLTGASLNSGNRGVNALTRGQIMLIYDIYGEDTQISILSYTVSNTINNQINYNNKTKIIKEIPCSIKNLLKTYIQSKFLKSGVIYDELKSSDMIWDISEGDSFSDIYGAKRFIKHSLTKLIALNMKVKLVIMPQTLGPFEKGWVKKIAKFILKKADKVFVRDEISKRVVNENLKVQREVKYIPDMAFYMNPDNNVHINKFVEDVNHVKIGVNVSALLYNGGYSGKNMFNLKCDYKNLVEKIIENLSSMDNVEIILIPHVMTTDFEVEDDFRVSKKIVEKIKKDRNIKIKTIDKFYKEDEIKAIISGCDFFIGSRMHACIGAISTCVPTVPIAYSRKFIGIWDKLGLSGCVSDPKTQEIDEILENIINNFNKRDEIKEVLNNKIPLLKNEIRGIGNIING